MIMGRLCEYMNSKELFLKANGICSMAGFNVRWWMYCLFKLFIGVFSCIFAVSLFNVSLYVIIILFPVMSVIPDYIVIMSNDNDNDMMLRDIKVLFDGLRIHVKAGVYISDAIAEIIPAVSAKRLKNGLIWLKDSIMLTNDIDKSLTDFNEMFNNRHIDTLVIILRQALVSGQSAESLDNAFSQMTDIEQAINIRAENSLERKIMIIQVMVLFGILMISGFCCISEFSGLFTAIK